jgi:glycosyltransferase involved in cell wall biosynthesis
VKVAILGIKQIPGVMGADRVVESLLSRLPAEHEYVVYVTRDCAPAPRGPRNVHFVRVPSLPGKHLHAATYFGLSSLHAALFGRYDVLHIHNSDFGAFCLPLRLRRSARIIGTFHGDPYARAKWGRLAKLFLQFSEKSFVRCADVLTSVSPEKQIDGRQIHYIPNGVDAWDRGAGTAEPLLRALGVTSGRCVMFAAGRIDATKGLHDLIQAFRELDTDAQLLAVGDFSHDLPYSHRLEAMAAGDPRIVLRKGLLPREQLLAAIAHSTAFVFPSQVEGMSMMLLEAISAGATVVCSDLPVNMEVVGANYPLTFRSGDVSSLRNALARALEPRRGHAEARVRERVLDRFRWDTVADRYGELYAA